jgi:hypothetical protein
MYYPPSAPPPSSKPKRRMCGDDSAEYGRYDDDSKRSKLFGEATQCEGMAVQMQMQCDGMQTPCGAMPMQMQYGATVMHGIETAAFAAIGAQPWRTATTTGVGLNGGWPKWNGG